VKIEAGYIKAITTILVVVAFFLSGCGPGIPVREKAKIEEHPGEHESPDMQFKFAGHLFHSGEYERSREEALKWLARYPMHPLKIRVLELIGDNFFAMGDNIQAFSWWLRAKRESSDNLQMQEDLNEKLNGLVEISELEVLERLAEYALGTEYIPKIYHKMATVFLAREEFEKAKVFAVSLIRSTSDPNWISIGNEILDRIQDVMSVRKGVVGCLLPLSGPYAVFGEEVLNGIQLGLGVSSKSSYNPIEELVIKDTGGSTDKALSGLEELVRKEKVMAVIGPLSSRTSAAVAENADFLGVPVITLTQKAGIVERGEMVFRNFLMPSQEVACLVDNAVIEMGIKRFAILYPDNSYGTFFMNLFWDQLEELGGKVTAVESYRLDETDFADQIKKMTGLYYKRPDSVLTALREKWTPEQEENEIYPEDPVPIVDFEAVFIPDDFQSVTMIAPQLAFHDVLDVQLLGTSLWQSPKMTEMISEYVQGAVFSSGFPQFSEEPDIINFIEEYTANFDSMPGVLAATGYDTIRILKMVMAEKENFTSKDLQKKIIDLENFQGVTGKTSFDSKGEVEKDIFLFSIAGKKITQLH